MAVLGNVGAGDVKALFQPKRFHDPIIALKMNSTANSIYLELNFKLNIPSISDSALLGHQHDGLAAVLAVGGEPQP